MKGTGRLGGLLRRPPGPGAPRTAFAYLPFLLLCMGAVSNVLRSETPNPVVGGVGLFVFNTLYIFVVFRSFDPERRSHPLTIAALAAMGIVTFSLAITMHGGGWLMFIPLLSLACGAVLRGRWLAGTLVLLAGAGATVAGLRNGPLDAVTIGYGSLISGLVAAALLSLSETIVELRETRQALARSAVEKERLRFSRDLHDLLGHTLSVIVVKSEAARRLGPRDLDAAMDQVADIETVGRNALAEIREAVTGYREGSLGSELDRARDALGAAGIATVVRQSGPPLPSGIAALLGWVVRESVTNAVRHSGAERCEIEVSRTDDRIRLVFTDDGRGPDPVTAWEDAATGHPGSGLRGLAERLAAVGGTLESGAAPERGFRVTADVPVDSTPDLR
ncbi:sensor histidine kinase [Streptomyces sp. YIM 130001]|uniref:sensor histidine kinase n=1 Tax=Streptomyces sp. YIM 130001 TaxID=2259644 RepID=UPI000E65E573|nr:sensor histidine kinase [Streptomyces sp. YIM 130001]